VEGPFQIVALEFSADHAGEVTFELALESAGQLSFEAA
jgi:predicted secreted protein